MVAVTPLHVQENVKIARSFPRKPLCRKQKAPKVAFSMNRIVPGENIKRACSMKLICQFRRAKWWRSDGDCGTDGRDIRYALSGMSAGLRFASAQSPEASRLECVSAVAGSRVRTAAVIKGGLPWTPGAADPPPVVTPDGWHFFTPQEAATVEALRRSSHPARSANAGRQGLRLCGVHRSAACRSLRQQRSLLHDGPVPGGHQAARSAIAAHHRAAISQGAGRVRCRLPRTNSAARSFAASIRRAEGRGDHGAGGRLVQARRLRRQNASSPKSSRTRKTAFSPIRSTAATRIWQRGR